MGLFDNCSPDFSIVCIWPFMPIDLGSGPDDLGMEPQRGEERHPSSGVDNEGNYNLPLGHAGILLVKGGTGLTRYFEYGRYSQDSSGNPVGRTRTYGVPNVTLNDDGWPTVSSLHNVVKVITRKSGKNASFHGNFDHKCGGFDPAVAYAESFNDPDYNIVSNSCMTFAHQVSAAGGFSWFGPIPVLDSWPADEVEAGLFHNFIMYFPDKDKFVESVWQISE